MRNLICRGGLCLALLAASVWWGSQFLEAQEEALSPKAAAGDRAGVLVLKTGQLVEGSISQSAGGYVVGVPNGSFLVPFERVSLVADDRRGAYKKVKAAEQNPTPEFQVALARWCMTWKLFEEARVELRDALIADPEHEEARRMYARLDQLMHPEKNTPPKPEPKNANGFEKAAPESLAGLSPESAKEYVVRVQPLLVNRCGNAGCHGPSSGQEFQITHVRGGLHRQTWKNLDAVLRYVDVSSPEESPLLKTPAGTHGRKGRPIFYGSTGEQNRETLKSWVAQAAKDLAGDPKEKKRSAAFARRDAFDQEPDETLIRGVPEPLKPVILTPEERANQEKDELLHAILRNEQQDAFDPEEFNRKN